MRCRAQLTQRDANDEAGAFAGPRFFNAEEHLMAKKKKYTPKEDNEWDEDKIKEHGRVIRGKEVILHAKYKRWWDSKKHRWKPDFPGLKQIEKKGIE